MKNYFRILIHEFEELKHEPLSISGYTIELFDQYNFYQWRITLLGAKDTPYADGIFFIKLLFPEDYPDSPPRIEFLTPIYHMNVYPGSGFVDVNFVKRDWQKNSKVREILTKLYTIFYLENPNSPCSSEQAYEYKKDRDLYYSKKEIFTKKYANIKSFKDFKPVKWDFSFPPKLKPFEITKYLNNNEKIKLSFDINGDLKKYCIDCNSNLNLRELIPRIIDMAGIKNFFGLLFIYEGRKLNEGLTLCENGLKNESHITIIHSVHY